MALQHNVWSYLRAMFHTYDGTTDAGGTTVTLDTNLRLAWRFPVVYKKTAADVAADTTTAATYFWSAPRACKILSASILSDGSLTAHDTNYATIEIENKAGTVLAVATTEVALSGGTGNWVAGTPAAMDVTANATISAGHALNLVISKAGTGVAVPVSALVLELEWN